MKKIKIMLTAVALMAVVGGAVAFKAAKVSRTFFTLNAAKTACNVPVVLFSTIDPTTTTTLGYTIAPTTILTSCSLVLKASN